MRSLHPSTASQPLRTFEAVKPFEVEAGVTAPWFGELGLGLQYRSPVTLGTLLERGILLKSRRRTQKSEQAFGRWKLTIEEVSVGVHRATAVDEVGRRIERIGTDPEKLRDECLQDVQDIEGTMD